MSYRELRELRELADHAAAVFGSLIIASMMIRCCQIHQGKNMNFFFEIYICQIEDVYRREQVERFNQRLREFEEDQRAYRNHHGDRQTESDLVEVISFNSIEINMIA